MDGLPEDVRRFILRHIDSIEQLEVLLLLWQSPERGWAVDEVAQALCTRPPLVVRGLARLLGQGLLREVDPGCYQYAPRGRELHESVCLTAELYRERPVTVVAAIAARPAEPMRAFADAFRIRRRKDD